MSCSKFCVFSPATGHRCVQLNEKTLKSIFSDTKGSDILARMISEYFEHSGTYLLDVYHWAYAVMKATKKDSVNDVFQELFTLINMFEPSSFFELYQLVKTKFHGQPLEGTTFHIVTDSATNRDSDDQIMALLLIACGATVIDYSESEHVTALTSFLNDAGISCDTVCGYNVWHHEKTPIFESISNVNLILACGAQMWSKIDYKDYHNIMISADPKFPRTVSEDSLLDIIKKIIDSQVFGEDGKCFVPLLPVVKDGVIVLLDGKVLFVGPNGDDTPATCYYDWRKGTLERSQRLDGCISSNNRSGKDSEGRTLQWCLSTFELHFERFTDILTTYNCEFM